MFLETRFKFLFGETQKEVLKVRGLRILDGVDPDFCSVVPMRFKLTITKTIPLAQFHPLYNIIDFHFTPIINRFPDPLQSTRVVRPVVGC